VFVSVKEARHLLEGAAFELDADRMLLPDVDATLDELGLVIRLAQGMVGKLGRRVGDAKKVARALHVPTGEVRSAVKTAELLGEFPATDAVVRRGELSAREAQLIAGAANVNPGAEAALLETAKLGLVRLHDACVKARAAVEDPSKRRNRQHGERYFRIGTDDDGMVAGRSGSRPRSVGRSKRSSTPKCSASSAHISRVSMNRTRRTRRMRSRRSCWTVRAAKRKRRRTS
jgi:hypothetical protein